MKRTMGHKSLRRCVLRKGAEKRAGEALHGLLVGTVEADIRWCGPEGARIDLMAGRGHRNSKTTKWTTEEKLAHEAGGTGKP